MQSNIPFKVLLKKENQKKIREFGRVKKKPKKKPTKEDNKLNAYLKNPQKKFSAKNSKSQKLQKASKNREKVQKFDQDNRRNNFKKRQANKKGKMKKIFYEVNGTKNEKNSEISQNEISEFRDDLSEQIGISWGGGKEEGDEISQLGDVQNDGLKRRVPQEY